LRSSLTLPRQGCASRGHQPLQPLGPSPAAATRPRPGRSDVTELARRRASCSSPVSPPWCWCWCWR